MPVGNVKSDDSVRRKVPAIKSESLRREQMQGDRVTGKCINNENIKALRRLSGERGSRVAGDDGDLGSGIADIGKTLRAIGSTAGLIS